MLITHDASAIASLMRAKPGSLTAYPTETFYGLGVLIDSRDGLDRIITVKGRDAAKGMIVLVSDMTMASCIAVIDNDQKKLLEILWPGPVSVVLEAKQDIDPLLAPDGKVALRISPNILATSLVEMVGPITSTSANRSGEPPARTAREVAGTGLAIDAILDGGETSGGKPSTLVDFTTWPPVCLREGAVIFQEILANCSYIR
jgi:L-threonylcarbamoyladenylate synthase